MSGRSRSISAVILSGILLLVTVMAPSAQATVLNSWQGATPLETFIPDTTSLSPSIATNEYGQAVAAWTWSFNGVYHIRVAYFDPDAGWSSPAVIDQAGGAFLPEVAMDRYGTAVVVWTIEDGGTKYVAGCAYRAGSGWNSTEILNPEGASAISALTVVNDRQDHFTVIYSKANATGWSIDSVDYWRLSSFAEPVVLVTSPEMITSTAAATNGHGEVSVVWSQLTGAQQAVRAITGKNGTWQVSPDLIATTARIPAVSVVQNGSALVTYGIVDGARAVIMTREHFGSVWSAAVERLNVTGSLDQLVISANEQGKGALAALVSNGTASELYLAEHNGTTWSNLTLLTSSAQDIYNLKLAQDSDDGARMTYLTIGNTPADFNHLYVSSKGEGVNWTIPEEIEGIGGGSPSLFYDLAASGVNYWLLFSRFEVGVDGESRMWIDEFQGIASGSALLTVDTSLVNATVNVPSVELRGTAEPGSMVSIGGLSVRVGEDGNYTIALPLKEGKNTFTLTTTDSMGRYAVEQVTITYSFGPAETAGLLAVFLGALAIIVSLVIMVLFLQYKRMKE